MNRPIPHLLTAVTTIALLLALPISASAQRGTIAVSATVAPATTAIPPMPTELRGLPGQVRDAIVRGRDGAIEAPRLRSEAQSGGSSWIITVKSAPFPTDTPPAPDRSVPGARPAAHVVTYTIAAAA